MKSDFGMSRRGFLRSAGSLGGVACLRLTGPALVAISQAACSARDEATPFGILGDAEARDFAAIAARIIPTTDTPGATEAGVIYFIDKAFGAEMRDVLGAARDGLAGFNAALAEAHPGAESLSALGEDEQDAFLKTQQDTDFFSLVRVMTMFGFFAMPSYGGNKDHVGWNLIGFEGHHGAWQYPFGHYDAAVHGETTDGE
jgi:gluconate 2-dehydrogenase gamma chain